MIERRGFLGLMLASCAAPAIVRSEVLMPSRQIILPPKLWGDGIHDDTAAIQWRIDHMQTVKFPTGKFLLDGPIIISNSANLDGGTFLRGNHDGDLFTVKRSVERISFENMTIDVRSPRQRGRPSSAFIVFSKA